MDTGNNNSSDVFWFSMDSDKQKAQTSAVIWEVVLSGSLSRADHLLGQLQAVN